MPPPNYSYFRIPRPSISLRYRFVSFVFQVVEQAAALAHELEQATAGMMVLLVRLESAR